MSHVNFYFLPLLFDGVEGENVGGVEEKDEEEDEDEEEEEEEEIKYGLKFRGKIDTRKMSITGN